MNNIDKQIEELQKQIDELKSQKAVNHVKLIDYLESHGYQQDSSYDCLYYMKEYDKDCNIVVFDDPYDYHRVTFTLRGKGSCRTYYYYVFYIEDDDDDMINALENLNLKKYLFKKSYQTIKYFNSDEKAQEYIDSTGRYDLDDFICVESKYEISQ